MSSVLLNFLNYLTPVILDILILDPPHDVLQSLLPARDPSLTLFYQNQFPTVELLIGTAPSASAPLVPLVVDFLADETVRNLRSVDPDIVEALDLFRSRQFRCDKCRIRQS